MDIISVKPIRHHQGDFVLILPDPVYYTWVTDKWRKRINFWLPQPTVKAITATQFRSVPYDIKIGRYMLIQKANFKLLYVCFCTDFAELQSILSFCFLDSCSASILNTPGMWVAVNQLCPVPNDLSFTIHFHRLSPAHFINCSYCWWIVNLS